jgi:AcrR family transcriptional regulator
MYCGSNKTALQSQRQIARAMMALIQDKPYSQITISELCKEAGISRQTFYSLFTSRENVMVFTLQANDCDTSELSLSEPVSDRISVLQWLCREYSGYLLRNRHLIKLLVDNRIDYLLYDSFYESMESCKCLWADADPCVRSYAAGFYAGGIASVARRYAQDGCTTTEEELEKMLMMLLSGNLF